MLNKYIPIVVDKIKTLSTRFGRWIREVTRPKHTKHLCVVADLFRSKPELVAENALLRQQLIVLNRQVKKPRFNSFDWKILVLLSRLNRSWRDAVLIVKPQTILRWHRTGYKLFWRFKTKSKGRKPRVSPETVLLIQQMARKNNSGEPNEYEVSYWNWVFAYQRELFRNIWEAGLHHEYRRAA